MPQFIEHKTLAYFLLGSDQGITTNVFESGFNNISDSLMPVKPLIDEPSNFGIPFVHASSSNVCAGTVTCCNFPGTSVNCRSINLMSSL